MKEVTEAEFKAALYHRNVHPCPERFETYWKDSTGRVVGRVTKGYCSRATYDKETGEASYPDAQYFTDYGG